MICPTGCAGQVFAVPAAVARLHASRPEGVAGVQQAIQLLVDD
jgi:hypothetical protein